VPFLAPEFLEMLNSSGECGDVQCDAGKMFDLRVLFLRFLNY
jgi:hypothetical protein